MVEQARADEVNRRADARAQAMSGRQAYVPPGQEQEGYWASMQRAVTARTENLNIMGDTMDRLEHNSASWNQDVNKFVSRQKKNLIMGGKSEIESHDRCHVDQHC